MVSQRSGAYAEYIAVSTRMLVHKPSGMSWVEAAGIPEARPSILTLAMHPLIDICIFHRHGSRLHRH